MSTTYADKKGAGGRLQNYDSHGRYAKTNYFISESPKESKKEKAQRREKHRREELFNRVKKSKDPYLFDVFLAIEDEMPGEVVGVNTKKFDCNIGHEREFDIITKNCIIEVKGQQVRRKLTQFLQQKSYAESKRKRHIVFAPEILSACQRDYEKNGIVITKSLNELIRIIKEFKK